MEGVIFSILLTSKIPILNLNRISSVLIYTYIYILSHIHSLHNSHLSQNAHSRRLSKSPANSLTDGQSIAVVPRPPRPEKGRRAVAIVGCEAAKEEMELRQITQREGPPRDRAAGIRGRRRRSEQARDSGCCGHRRRGGGGGSGCPGGRGGGAADEQRAVQCRCCYLRGAR